LLETAPMTSFRNLRVALTLSKRKAGWLACQLSNFCCPDFATEDLFLAADDHSGSHQRMYHVDESKPDLPTASPVVSESC